jgi:hypothetical protein
MISYYYIPLYVCKHFPDFIDHNLTVLSIEHDNTYDWQDDNRQDVTAPS